MVDHEFGVSRGDVGLQPPGNWRDRDIGTVGQSCFGVTWVGIPRSDESGHARASRGWGIDKKVRRDHVCRGT